MKINVYDNSIMVIKSDNKLSEINKVAAYDPKCLQKVDDEGNLQYSVQIAKSGKGTMNNIGVQFSPEAGDDGLAKITIELPAMENGVNVKDYIAEKYSFAIESLQAIDNQIVAALSRMGQTRDRVRQLINIVG